MSDDEPNESARPAAAGADPAPPAGSTGESATRRDVRSYVEYALLAGLLLLGFIALVQFYLSASSAISTWINQEYRQLFRAVFNLVVLLLVATVVSRLLRRIDR